ncbi:hypothetical protein CHU98_g4955 [Xylaria longipes]|nr:hypothetical protein CHU98_g4955 [Xylaria longipes]
MIALGPSESTIDFVVVQFANDVPVEDCQEVALEDGGKGEAEATDRIWDVILGKVSWQSTCAASETVPQRQLASTEATNTRCRFGAYST